MGDENQPSKKRAAGRELSRDNPGLDDEEVEEQEVGTFKKASDEVLATRKIVKVRRQQTTSVPSAPSSNPFAGIRLVPPAPVPAPANATVEKDRDDASEDADTKDDADSEFEVKKVGSEDNPGDATTESNSGKEKEVPTEQAPAVCQPDLADDTAGKAAEAKPNEADGSSEKTAESESVGELQPDGDNGENGDKNENEKPDGSESGGAPLNSFQQLSNSQNAFTGLTGSGFSSSTFSFGSFQKDGSSSQSSLPSFSFASSNNGSTPLFGTVMAGTSIGTKTEGPTFRSMQEVPTETGEENEEMVFSADSALFEFFDGGWKERGKGEVKVNVLKGETQKARMVMRAKGNLRLILNASLFPDMKLTKMDKKGVTFACVNIAAEGKDGLSTFALKFKDALVMEEFASAVSAHKGKPATTALKTPENSPKASED